MDDYRIRVSFKTEVLLETKEDVERVLKEIEKKFVPVLNSYWEWEKNGDGCFVVTLRGRTVEPYVLVKEVKAFSSPEEAAETLFH